MTPSKSVRGALTLCILAVLTLAACAQSADTYDEDATEAQIVEYFEAFYPQLSQLEVESIQEKEGSPFLEVSISFLNRGRKQTQSVWITPDRKHLVLGQVWDLTKDPKRVQWEQKKEGAEDRLAKLDLSQSPHKGNPDAEVVVVEYSDYQCPYCSRAYSTLENQLIENYGDRVKFVYKHLPLEQLHPWAKKASVAAVCAQEQSLEGFWTIHRLLFENQRAITTENLRDKVEEFAAQTSLEVGPLMECFDNEATVAQVEADMREAGQLGITSTPTFLVNGALISGAVPFEEMSGYVNRALEDANQGQDER